MKLRAIAAALVLLLPSLFHGAAALGQDQLDIGVEGRVFKFQMEGLNLTIPAPLWTLDNADTPALEQTKPVASRVRPGVSTLNFRRVDENAAIWTEIMGLIVVRLPGYKAGQQFKAVGDSLGQKCRLDKLELFWIAPLPGSDREALVGLCGEYAIEARQAQPCVGGIITAVAVERAEGVLSTYHEWCTESFNVAEEGRWPVSRDIIETHARQLQQFTDFEPVKTN